MCWKIQWYFDFWGFLFCYKQDNYSCLFVLYVYLPVGFGAVEMPYLCPQRNKSGEVLIVFYGTHNTIGNLSSTVEYQSWEMLGYSQNYSGRRYFWKENLYFWSHEQHGKHIYHENQTPIDSSVPKRLSYIRVEITSYYINFLKRQMNSNPYWLTFWLPFLIRRLYSAVTSPLGFILLGLIIIYFEVISEESKLSCSYIMSSPCLYSNFTCTEVIAKGKAKHGHTDVIVS